MQPVRQSVIPPPPSPSGSMKEVNPTSAALFHTSLGSSVSDSSTACEMGRISRAAKSRQTRWISRCSGVISNGGLGIKARGLLHGAPVELVVDVAAGDDEHDRFLEVVERIQRRERRGSRPL